MNIPYIPYFQTSRYRVQTMIYLAEIKPGEKAADLGCGDGRIIIALAKKGAIATGYELDDKLFILAQENIKNEFSNNTNTLIPELIGGPDSYPRGNDKHTSIPSPTILKKDFWFEDLSQYSIICCYPMPTIMGRLEKKLQAELKPGSRVLLNYFPFKHWKLTATRDNIYLYRKV